MFDEFNEVLSLANNAIEFVNNIKKITKKPKDKKLDDNSAKIGSSGNSAKIGSSGYSAKIGSSGDYAQIGSSGYSAQIGISGYSAKIGSSGDYAKINCTGKNSIISAIGLYSTVITKIGNWITLAEFKKENDTIIVDYIKTEFVDGDKIKGDVRYCLYNHRFQEVVCFDEIDAIVLAKKKNVYKVITFKDYFTKKESFIVTDGENYSHGKTIKQAKADLIYKISNRDTSQFNNLTLDSVLPKEDAIKMYRIITGACEFGTKQFVSSLKKTKKEYSVKEIIDITSGQFGNEKLKQFFKDK